MRILFLIGLGFLGLAILLFALHGGATPSLGKVWADFHVASLNLVQAVIERYLWPPLWSDILFPVIRQRADLVLGGIGLVLVLISRHRRRR